MSITWYEIAMLVGVPAICVLILQFIFNLISSKAKDSKRDSQLLKLGVQALLRDRLMAEYKLHSKKGWIEVAEKDNYNNMYQQYHGLGKNGVMDEMHSEIMKLPTEKPNNKK